MIERKHLANLLLVLLSTLLTYAAVEVAYRYYLQDTLRTQLVTALFDMGRAGGPGSTAQFDAHTGFRYLPDKLWRNSGGYQLNQWRTNEHGLIANDIDRSRYPVAKPPGEFRLALLGDSFTASNAVYLRWADLLQDYLNRSPRWREYTGGKFTRVLNFGLDGTGVVQWSPVYEHYASRFSPDMVVVNIFIEDVMRQFIHRGQHTFSDDAEWRAHVEATVDADLVRINWYEVYPEILAKTIGRHIGLHPRLMQSLSVTNPLFVTQAQGIEHSLASLQRIRCLNPRTVILYNPALQEMKVPEDTARRWPGTPHLVGLQTKFMAAAAAAQVPVVNLAERNPRPGSYREVEALYNLPLDVHMSDYGVVIYAGWIYHYLLDWLQAPSGAASAHEACP